MMPNFSSRLYLLFICSLGVCHQVSLKRSSHVSGKSSMYIFCCVFNEVITWIVFWRERFIIEESTLDIEWLVPFLTQFMRWHYTAVLTALFSCKKYVLNNNI